MGGSFRDDTPFRQPSAAMPCFQKPPPAKFRSHGSPPIYPILRPRSPIPLAFRSDRAAPTAQRPLHKT
eukprot:15451802-Alexandrium_andersonii.AAC.1